MSASGEGGRTDDLYWDAIQEQWEKILDWYQLFADKNPVMLYDLQEQKIYAYPYEEFKKELGQKSQSSLAAQYQRATKNNHMVVFVRDNQKRKLVSYTVSIDQSEGTGK
jgi:hypothetical protein